MGRRRDLALAGLAAVATASISSVAPAAAQSQDLGKIFSDVLHQRLPGDSQNLTSDEVSEGLKEALSLAADRAGSRLGAKDGFFQDRSVRIGLPGVLGDAQKRLKPFGMSGPLDDLELRINRGAEAAMPAARTLVVDAVRSMTIDDAMSVLRGGDQAATDLLRAKTEVGLQQALAPYVEAALADSGALQAMDGVVARYGAGLVQTDAREILVSSAVSGAVDGLFHYVAEEELAIRRDPVKRSTELLRKVFGG